MLRRALAAAWYGDCRLDGQLAYLTNLPNVGWRVQVNDLLPIVPPDDIPLYLRVTDDGPLKLCGQGWNTGAAIQYDADMNAWTMPSPATYGVNPLIFKGQDLVFSTVADGSQGFRYVASDGRVITGDQTINHGTDWAQQCHLIGPLWEWSHFDGLSIGQGESGCIAEWQGKRYVLSTGQVYFIRVRRKDTAVAVYLVKPGYAEALWFDVSELGSADFPLEPPPIIPPPEPVQKPPVITVTHYDQLFKAGLPWVLDFTNSDGTTFHVSKDAQDRLWIAAENAAGSTSTGQVRQLTVEGPSTPEPPEPLPMPTLGRFWLQPNIGSLDETALPGNLATVDVVAIPIQQILTDTPTDQLGPNNYPALVAAGFFKSLKDAATPLVVEMGSVKDGNCQALNSINEVQTAVQRVTDAGGVIAGFSADEPLTNSRGCHQSMEATADAHANWHHAIKALGPMQVIWLEGWPDYTTLADIQTFFHLLQQRDALPNAFHPDVYWDHSTDAKAAEFLRGCQQTCDLYGVTLGAFINSTKDPIATDVLHHQNLLALAAKVYGIVPDVAQVHVAAWAHRVSPDPTHKTQNVPANLGAKGLLDTFASVRTIFGSTTPPIEPPEETAPMLYKLMDPVTHGLIGYKLLKPVAGETGVYTAILPDDTVASIQPGGEFETRPAGTEGAYEKCSKSGELLLYHPITEGRWAYASAQVIR